MVCIKEASPVGSEPAESIIHSYISPKCGKYRTLRLMRHIFALHKSPKINLYL
jgi:hypothetical protein